MALAPLLSAALFGAASLLVARTASPLQARRRAAVSAAVAFALACALARLGAEPGPPVHAFGVRLRLVPPGLHGSASLVTCAVAWVALAMSPLASHPPRVLGRMLLLFGLSSLALATDGAGVTVLAWALSVQVVRRELHSRARTAAVGRLFERYHVPSVALLAVGSGLLALGFPRPGVIACSLGIAIRVAVVPVHGWFPRFVQRAPLGLVVAFSLPQPGVHAHLLLLSGQLPPSMHHLVAALGAITAVLCACLSVVQREARRSLAFLTLSQGGLVAFGLENESEVARTGAVLAWLVLALATTGFLMSLAALEARRGTLSLSEPSGSFERTPRMAVAFLLFGFASVGLPLTIGFIAEDLLLQGSSQEFPALGFALIVATAVNGIAVMRSFFALFSGTRSHRGERDLTGREIGAVTLTLGLLFAGGLFPDRLLGAGAPEPAETITPPRTSPPGDPPAASTLEPTNEERP